MNKILWIIIGNNQNVSGWLYVQAAIVAVIISHNEKL